MQPLLNTDMRSNPSHSDVVLLERWAVALGLIKRGDVVTFWNPSDPNRLAAKRVVGLAGDIVRPRKPELSEPIRVPAGSVWVEGDSAATSVDSNTMGPVCQVESWTDYRFLWGCWTLEWDSSFGL